MTSLVCNRTITPALNDPNWTTRHSILNLISHSKTDVDFSISEVIACQLAVLSENDQGLRLREVLIYGIGKYMLLYSYVVQVVFQYIVVLTQQ